MESVTKHIIRVRNCNQKCVVAFFFFFFFSFFYGGLIYIARKLNSVLIVSEGERVAQVDSTR